MLTGCYVILSTPAISRRTSEGSIRTRVSAWVILEYFCCTRSHLHLFFPDGGTEAKAEYRVRIWMLLTLHLSMLVIGQCPGAPTAGCPSLCREFRGDNWRKSFHQNDLVRLQRTNQDFIVFTQKPQRLHGGPESLMASGPPVWVYAILRLLLITLAAWVAQCFSYRRAS